MIREIIIIDESLCDGCGACIPNCQEGALQLIDGKARLVHTVMCDGLGACLGHCPRQAIRIAHREAAAYDENEVLKRLIPQGKNMLIAHLRHLREHGQLDLLRQAVEELKREENAKGLDVPAILRAVHRAGGGLSGSQSGCPGTVSGELVSLAYAGQTDETRNASGGKRSALTHWPVQLHLINPAASYFRGADLLVAADCTAFASSEFHLHFLAGRKLVIACPKLDDGQSIYLEKLIRLIDEAEVRQMTVLRMEVPCCGGLWRLVNLAVQKSVRTVPVREQVLSVRGELLHSRTDDD